MDIIKKLVNVIRNYDDVMSKDNVYVADMVDIAETSAEWTLIDGPKDGTVKCEVKFDIEYKHYPAKHASVTADFKMDGDTVEGMFDLDSLQCQVNGIPYRCKSDMGTIVNYLIGKGYGPSKETLGTGETIPDLDTLKWDLGLLNVKRSWLANGSASVTAEEIKDMEDDIHSRCAKLGIELD